MLLGKTSLPLKTSAASTQPSKKRHQDVARRKESLLGTNQFPNFTEVAGNKIEKTDGCNCGCKHDAQEGAVASIPTARAASDFEALRLATEKSSVRPKVFMLTIGNLAMRLARAQFSSNFFACAGYEIIDNLGFKTWCSAQATTNTPNMHRKHSSCSTAAPSLL